MKKQFFLVYIFLCIGVIYSLNIDYGASIDSYLGLNLSSDTSIYGFEKVSLYGSSQFTENISLSMDGYFKYLYNTSDSGTYEPYVDFETLVLSLPIGNLNIDIGRDSMGDYSGRILSHTLDGLVVTIPLSFATLQTKAGFSGLVNENEVSLISTTSDSGNISRIIEGADLIKELESTTLYASLYALQDMDDLTNNLAIYLGGGVDGSVGSFVYYSVAGNLQTGLFPYIESTSSEEANAGILAGAGSISVNWFIQSDNELLKSMSPYVSFNLGVSSGDSSLTSTGLGESQSEDLSGGISLYTPMISSGPGVIYTISNQNLTYIKVDGSVSPLKNLQTKLGTTLFFRTVEGPVSSISSTGFASSSGRYLGTELSLTGNYRIYSDLGVSLTTGIFLPSELSNESVNGIIAGYVSLSL